MEEELTNAVSAYLREQGAEFAYLFGSRATATHTPESDYDFAVLMPQPLDPLDGLSLAAKMERELATICRGEVDVVLLNMASPLLYFEVIRNGKVLVSCDEERRIRTEMRARAAYEDFCHFQSFFVRQMRKDLAS